MPKTKNRRGKFWGWWWYLLILLLGNNICWLRKTFSTPGIELVITFFVSAFFIIFSSNNISFLFTREFNFFHRVSHNNDFLLVHRVIHGNFGRHKIRCSSQNSASFYNNECVYVLIFFRDPKSNVFKKTSCKIFVYFVGGL